MFRGHRAIRKCCLGAVCAALPLLAGCASEPLGNSFSSEASYLGLKPSMMDTREHSQSATLAGLQRKSIASKVLSAMAFERVTGLKADPARLLEAE